MKSMAAKVIILMVVGFALSEGLQFEPPLIKKGAPSPSLDLSPINTTVDTVTQIIEQVNTTVGDMSTPLMDAAETWTESLADLQTAYTAVSAAAIMSPGDDKVGDALKALLPQLNESITSATKQLPAATASVQSSLTKALSKFTALADKSYAALTKANDEVAKVSASADAASLTTARGRKQAALISKSVKAKVATATGKRAATAKAANKQTSRRGAADKNEMKGARRKLQRRRLVARRKKSKRARRVALLETRAGQNLDEDVSTMDRAVSRKGAKEPYASIAAANKSIDKLSGALADLGDGTVNEAFSKIAAAANGGLDSFNQTAQKAIAEAGKTVASDGGAQAAVAQKALDAVKASLDTIISTAQVGIQDANTTGLEAVEALITDANTSLQQVSALGATLQGQADAAVEAAAAAKNSTA